MIQDEEYVEAEGSLSLLDILQQPSQNQQLSIQLADPQTDKEKGNINIEVMWAPETY